MPRKLVSFDWAMKKILRDKANFDILEGFLQHLSQKSRLKRSCSILKFQWKKTTENNNQINYNIR